MPQSYDYLIAPKASFDATADAIRAKTSSQASITWGQDGFASAISSIVAGLSADTIATGISGDITLTVSQVKAYAFYGCTALTGVTAQSCTIIGTYAFYGCTALEDVTLANDSSSLGADAFCGCSSLDGVDFSHISSIPADCFKNASVKNCLFNPTSVAGGGFRDATYWSYTKLPNLTTISGTYSFAGIYDSSTKHSTATTLVLPVLTSIASNNAFSYNYSLEAVDLGAVATIQASTFTNNSSMNVLILRGSSAAALSNTNAFTGTPFASGGTGGTLYVSNDLISSYTSASNWSTILGYTNNSIKSIESTHTDPNATIDLTTHYADGTLIPT